MEGEREIPEDPQQSSINSSIKHVSADEKHSGPDDDDNIRPEFSSRKWLVGPIVILYIGGYIIAFSTFVQYLYIRIQKEHFPNATFNNSVSKCYVNKSDPNYQIQVQAQKEASLWQGYFALFVGIPAVIANIILGCYTDSFGRKFLFFLPCVGTCIRIGVSTVGIYTGFPLLYFATGFVVEGLTGSEFTLFLVSLSYVADITPVGKQRSFGIVLVEFAIGMGRTAFSFVGGYFIRYTGFFYPMATALAMIACSLFMAFFLPESFPKDKRRPSASIVENVKVIYNLFCSIRNRGRRWLFNVTLLVFALTMFAIFGRNTIDPLYQLNSPFCWKPQNIGWYGTLRGAIQQIFSIGLIKVFQRFMSDESIAMFGCISYAAGFTLEGLSQNSWMLYSVTVVASCGILTVPMARSILSKMTPSDKQGAIFASISATEAMVKLVASVASSAIYYGTVAFFGGFVYFVFVFCNLSSFVLMGFLKHGKRRTMYESLP